MDRRRAIMAAGAAGALMVVVVAANLLGSWRIDPRFNLPFAPAKGTPPPYTPQAAPSLPPGSGRPPLSADPLISEDLLGTVLRVLVGIVAVAVAVLVAGLLWRLRRPADVAAAPAAPQVSMHEAVRDAVATARSYLQRHRATGDAARSIIGAWAALEQAAAASGHQRRPEHTPSEFTADLLRRVSGAESEIAALLRLYHQARYGSASVVAALTEADADRADRLLVAIADQLEDQPDSPFRRPSNAADTATAADPQGRHG